MLTDILSFSGSDQRNIYPGRIFSTKQEKEVNQRSSSTIEGGTVGEEELGEGEVVSVEDVSRPLRRGEGGENEGGRGGDILEFGKVRCGVRGETFD